MEIGIAYLGSTINDKNYERPINMRMGILSERKTGMIINQNILSPDDDDAQEIFSLFIPIIMEQDSKPR